MGSKRWKQKGVGANEGRRLADVSFLFVGALESYLG